MLTTKGVSQDKKTAKVFGIMVCVSLICCMSLMNAQAELLSSTFIGGSGSDPIRDMFVDSSGNIYITGQTDSSNFPTTPGCFDNSHNGDLDVFVAKLNPTGNQLLYATYIGGSGQDVGAGITVDSAGNIYVSGWTYSSDFPTQNAIQPTSGGGLDGFIVKLDSSGSLIFSTYFGGSSRDPFIELALDSAGNVYAVGYSDSSNFPVKNPYQGQFMGGWSDVIVVKLSADGSSLHYATYIGGSGEEHCHGIAVDSTGNAYIAGITNSSNYPTVNPIQASFAGTYDVVVTKLSQSGDSLSFSTYLGGSGYDYGLAVAIDSSGNAYATGYADPGFPTTAGVLNPTSSGRGVFVSKFNTNGGNLSYSTFIGDKGGAVGSKIFVDASGHAYVGGYVADIADFPVTEGAFDTSHNGIYDAFAAKLSTDGDSLQYSTFLGGTDYDYGAAIFVNNSGNICIAGQTQSSDFPTKNPFQTGFAGTEDGFVASFSISTAPLVNRALSLDGDGDYVDMSNDYVLGDNDFVISLWLNNLVQSVTWTDVLGQWSSGIGNESFLIAYDTDRVLKFLYTTNGNTDIFALTAPTAFTLNEWLKLDIVRDGTTMKMYIDGIEVDSYNAGTDSIYDSTRTLRLGARSASADFNFNGLIDEVCIWNRALSQAEIYATMHSPLKGNEDGLVAYWRFDEAPGSTIAHDSSGNGNHGTLYGDANFVPPDAPIINTGAYVSIQNSQGSPGATVLVPIMVENVTGIGSIDLTINYNADILTPGNAQTTALITDWEIDSYVTTPGTLKVTTAYYTQPAGDGALIEIPFTVSPDAQQGDYTLTLAEARINEGNIDSHLTSGILEVTETASDTTPPTPNTITDIISTSSTQINITSTEATDDTLPVYYHLGGQYYNNTSWVDNEGGVSDYDWSTSRPNPFTDDGLAANGLYRYRQKVKDSASPANESTWSDWQEKATLLNLPQDVEISFSNISETGLHLTVASPPKPSGIGQTAAYFDLITGQGQGTGANDRNWADDYTAEYSNLEPNTQYGFKVNYRNYEGTETNSNPNEQKKYTRANTPSAPTVTNPTSTTLDITVEPNGNPSHTLFAIYNVTDDYYLNESGGSNGNTEMWQTQTDWGIVTIINLASETTYEFKCKAQNGDGVITNLGASGFGTTSPLVNRALSLDGDGDYVEIADAGSLDLTNNFTFETWIFPVVLYAGENMIFNKENTYEWSIINGNLQWALMTAGTWQWFDTGVSVPLNQWTHLALTYASPNVNVYKNGLLLSTLPDPQGGDLDTTDYALRIGARGAPGSAASFFNGLLDEVRIWNRVLSQADIQDIMNSPLHGTENGLVGYWRCNESPGTRIAHDSSGNGNDGTLYNDADFVIPEIQDNTPPTPNTILSTTAISANQIDITSQEATDDTPPVYYRLDGQYYNNTSWVDNEGGVSNYDWSTTRPNQYTDDELVDNGLYRYRQKVKDSTSPANESTWSDWQERYTLANIPSAPTISNPTSTTLNITVEPNGNPSHTLFAIYNVTDDYYVNESGGTNGNTEVWQTQTDWGTVTVINLSSGTTYEFKCKAKNGDGIETPLSNAAQGTPQPSYSGPIWYVSKTGSDGNDGSQEQPFATIQRGIDAASDEHTVLVADGTYTGEGNKNLDFKGKDIIVMSENGAEHCIIDCQGNGRSFYFHSGETNQAVVKGFTIKNGNSDLGGGIYCDNASPTISHNIICDNITSVGGGGIYCCNNADAVIDSNVIRNNIATTNQPGKGIGGGIWCYGESDALIINNLILKNRVNRYAGAVACNTNSSAIIANNTIVGNTAYDLSAAFHGADSNVRIFNNIFKDNVSDERHEPGGIYYHPAGSCTISYCNIDGDVDGEGNINAAPLFVDPDNGDYHLQSDSPCINAGTPDDAPSNDIEGNERDSNPDMGAYENSVIQLCTVKILPESQSIQVGQTTTITIQIENVTNFGGFEFKLRYKTNTIEITENDIQFGDFLTSTGREVIPIDKPKFSADGEYTILFYGAATYGEQPPVSGGGILANIELKGISAGTTELDLFDVKVSDIDVNPISVAVIDSSITVQTPTDTTPPVIRIHTPITSSPAGVNLQITGEVTDAESQIAQVSLYYQIGEDPQVSLIMAPEGNDIYSATIPAEHVTTQGLRYYLEAYNDRNLHTTDMYKFHEENWVWFADKDNPQEVTVTLKFGDINGDGKITALDAVLVLQNIVGLITLTVEQQDAADVTGYGGISALDAALILQRSVGLISKFPREQPNIAPALKLKSENQLLTEAISELEIISLNKAQKTVLEQLKQLAFQQTIPKKTTLLPNYPNPFNPETWIPYELAKESEITINVYNAKGQLIRTLHFGKKLAGVYTSRERAAYWDGCNQRGENASSGIYFYTIKAGDFTATRKMLLVK